MHLGRKRVFAFENIQNGCKVNSSNSFLLAQRLKRFSVQKYQFASTRRLSPSAIFDK